MQNKTTKKIIIDATKLETLLRLGCSEKVISDYIIHDKLTKQKDELINTILESLIDRKTFSNWGGNHNPSGKNQHKIKEVGQVDQAQLGGQVVDKDKDKDKDKIKIEDKNREIIKDIINKFKNILTKYKGREVETKSWDKHIRLMLEKDKITSEQIIKVLDWYSKHIGEPYIPVVLGGESLREKFTKLEEAIKRTAEKTESFQHWSKW